MNPLSHHHYHQAQVVYDKESPHGNHHNRLNEVNQSESHQLEKKVDKTMLDYFLQLQHALFLHYHELEQRGYQTEKSIPLHEDGATDAEKQLFKVDRIGRNLTEMFRVVVNPESDPAVVTAIYRGLRAGAKKIAWTDWCVGESRRHEEDVYDEFDLDTFRRLVSQLASGGEGINIGRVFFVPACLSWLAPLIMDAEKFGECKVMEEVWQNVKKRIGTVHGGCCSLFPVKDRK
ncbi:hypothetical protein T439DRAFT_360866 [Meredithblackwellia eburnea MCA 4105]